MEGCVMLYNIVINQTLLHREKLDFRHSAVMEVFKQFFSSNSKKIINQIKVVDNETWYWVSCFLIKDDLPCFKNFHSTNTIKKVIDDLFNKKFINKKIIRDGKKQRSYYTQGERFEEFFKSVDLGQTTKNGESPPPDRSTSSVKNHITSREAEPGKAAAVSVSSRKGRVFQKPTVFEIEKFCRENQFTQTDAEEFWNHYQSIGWVVGKVKAPMKDWQAAVRKWEKRSKEWKQQKENHQGNAGFNDLNHFAPGKADLGGNNQ